MIEASKTFEATTTENNSHSTAWDVTAKVLEVALHSLAAGFLFGAGGMLADRVFTSQKSASLVSLPGGRVNTG